MSVVIAAAKRLAVRQERGISGMAEMIGVNPTTLSHKLDRQGSANLFVTEIEQMTSVSRDPEIAQALAFLCDHVCIPVAPMVEHGELGREIVAVGKEFGDLMQATQQAIEDRRVTTRELAHFERQFMELISAAVMLRTKLKSMIPAPAAELKVAK